MTTELLDCPFCGAMPEIEEDGLGGTSIWCNNQECTVHVEYTHHVGREEAIAAWNRRVVPDAPKPLLTAAAAALEWIDEIYRADIFDGSSGDEGPVRIVAIRENLRRALVQEPAP